MKKGYITHCDSCGKDYYYESTGNIWPGGKDRETATCAYAGPVVQAFRRPWCIDSGFMVHAFR